MLVINKILLLNFFFILSTYLSGCSSLTSPARSHALLKNTPYWFDYSSDRRGAILIPKEKNKRITICAEPSPDTAIETLAKLGLNIKNKGNINTELNQKIIQLTTRTQTILFLRESLYRLCELSANFDLSNSDIIEQYSSVINAATELAKAEVIQAETDQTNANINAFKIRQKSNNQN